MASAIAWQRIHKILHITYGKLYDTDRRTALYQLLVDVEDADLEEAVATHCNDPETGEYPPKPSQIRANLTEIDARRAKERAQGLKLAEAEYQRAEPPAQVYQASTDQRRRTGQVEFRVRPSRCELCQETGFRSYYLPKQMAEPADKYQVFEESEYLALPTAAQGFYRLYRAVCDCSAGKLRRKRYAGIISGFVSEGRSYRAWPLVEEVEKMAARRRQQEARNIGMEA